MTRACDIRLRCWQWGVLLLLAVGMGSLCGCVQRRMTIRTNPPGAMVYVDEYPIGVSPISASFTFYGTRRIRLIKDGYEPLTIMEPMWPPWYEIPPLDFVSENFVPGELRDQRDFCYQLKPQVVVPPEQLLARGEELRRNQPVSPLALPPVSRTPVLPPPGQSPGVPGVPPASAAPALPPAQPGVAQPVPEAIPAPQPIGPVPQQGAAPVQPGLTPGQPDIGGQLPHPLPPP